jgi:hypothetical protein
MAAHIADQICQEQLSPAGAHAVLGRLLTHNLRPLADGRAQRAGRSLDPRRESALSRHTPPGGHRAPALAAHADMITVDSGPGPAGGHHRRSRTLSLPFRNGACTGQSGWKSVIPLRAPVSDANLKL